MTYLQRYLAEEVALDHADRLISRREAIRRLIMLGLSATAAGAVLAACGERAAQITPTMTAAPTTPAAQATVRAENVTFAGPEGRKLLGAWAAAETARGGVLVVHENRGLTAHIRSVATRLAGSGFSALAIDLLSEEGGTASFEDEAAAMAALGRVPPERFDADMRAGLSEIERRSPGAKLGAVGFCFGGGMVWRLVDTGDTRLAAAIPFYGPFPDGANLMGSKAAVLGVYAEQDGRVNASRDDAQNALQRAGLTHEIETFPGVDHAFFNDTGPRYNARAASDAYKRVLEWFGRHLSA